MFGNYTLSESLSRVDSGWHVLVQTFFRGIKDKPEVKVLQIKEKFGGLRIYVDNADPEVHALIRELESDSMSICEKCGQPGTQRSVKGWTHTICLECYEIGKSASKHYEGDYTI